jgi:hypothetical protein
MIPSLPKLLGLFAIIWLVWTCFRIYETRQTVTRARTDEKKRGRAPVDDDGDHEGPFGKGSVELRECKVCFAWVSGENCGQENCPY